MTLTTKGAETLAEVIDGHAYTYPDSFCECGDYLSGSWADWRDHLTEVLIASGAVRREAEVRAEAWRASRLDLAHELRESGAWSEVRMAEWVEMRADRAALAEEGDR